MDWLFWLNWAWIILVTGYLAFSKYYSYWQKAGDELFLWRVSAWDRLRLASCRKKALAILLSPYVCLIGLLVLAEGLPAMAQHFSAIENPVALGIVWLLTLACSIYWIVEVWKNTVRKQEWVIATKGIYCRQKLVMYGWKHIASFRRKRQGVFELKWKFFGLTMLRPLTLYVPEYEAKVYELLKQFVLEELPTEIS